jgi:uncharacterized membrane protein
VPHSFEELLITVRGFFAFGISFMILVLIWIEQHRFFRRYGMDDPWILFLNILLLFIVLFYVYPLKFLFSLIFSDQIYKNLHSPFQITLHQVPVLMMIYAAGFIIIYTLFFLMHQHASRRWKAIGLSPFERFECRSQMYKELIMVSVGICSLAIACWVPDKYIGIAGYVYVLIPLVITIFYTFRNRIRRRIFK